MSSQFSIASVTVDSSLAQKGDLIFAMPPGAVVALSQFVQTYGRCTVTRKRSCDPYETAGYVAGQAVRQVKPGAPTGTVSVSKRLSITALLQAVSVWTRTTRRGSSHMRAAKPSAKRKPSWSPWLPTEQETPFPRVALPRFLHQAPLPRPRLKPATTAYRMVNQNRARRIVLPGLARVFWRRSGDVKGAHLPPQLTTNVRVSRSLAARSTVRFSNSPNMFGKPWVLSVGE